MPRRIFTQLLLRAAAAPADGDLATSETALYLDTTAGAPKVMAKGKDSAGTVYSRDLTLGAGLATSGKGWVNHGSTAGTARPTGYASVEWYGSVQPSNAQVGDTWVDTA